MKSSKFDSVVIVVNKTRLERLEAQFNTKGQAQFYIEQQALNELAKASKFKKEAPSPKAMKAAKDDSFKDYQTEHDSFFIGLEKVKSTISRYTKVKVIEKSYLTNYLFSENEIVIVIGQDGLVANTAKYVNSLPIIAINPDVNRYDGALLPFRPDNFETALIRVLENNFNYKEVTMAEAKLNDGQRLLAFNDLFIGPASHISARYRIEFLGQKENQSSSGIIVSTGAGSTGWMSSLINMANKINESLLKNPVSNKGFQLNWGDSKLLFIVREPFLSKHSQINLTAGVIDASNSLVLESMMPENGIIFSDGVDRDFIKFNSGSIATIGVAPEKAKIVTA